MKHFTLPYHVPPWGPMSTCSVHEGLHGVVGRPAELAAEVVAECSLPPGPGVAAKRENEGEGRRRVPQAGGRPARVVPGRGPIPRKRHTGALPCA